MTHVKLRCAPEGDAGAENLLVLRGTTYPATKRTWYITSINLFEGLDASEIDAWVARCGPRIFEPGQRIIDSDSTPPEQVLVVRDGAVRLFVTSKRGRPETVDLVGPGQLFGVSTAFGDSALNLNADALTRVVVCAAEGRSFLLDLAASTEIVLNLVRQAGGRVVRFGADYRHTQQPPAEVRLAQVLRRLALTAGEPVHGNRRIPACVSRGTLAHQVGCTRETVARMLANLEASGGVKRHGRTIEVNLELLPRYG